MKLKTLFSWAMGFFVLFALVILPGAVLAQTDIDPGLEYLTQTGLTSTDIRETIANIIKVIMGFLGTLAVVIILVGGFKWMTAAGNEDKVSEAKKLLMQGVIGLAIVLAAYSIATFVIRGLIEATS
ncbi:MAG: pilin [Patescibacteria group bacterium]|nr:pilin [Patescibacteria group bacterium]MDD5490832.1 pilin [Patescibacteria group bacterium]